MTNVLQPQKRLYRSEQKLVRKQPRLLVLQKVKVSLKLEPQNKALKQKSMLWILNHPRQPERLVLRGEQ